MRAFLKSALATLHADERILGVAVGGSLSSGEVDEFSDIDLVIAVEPAAFVAVMTERKALAGGLGDLVAAFTREHVGEPRLLICLYQPGPLHVDLEFVALPDVNPRVEDPLVLWEREGRLTAELAKGVAGFPRPDPQWIEDRFWIWVHYCATKIGRGELFEAADFLAYLRSQVFGPLILLEAGQRPSGVRRLETAAPTRARQLEAAVATHDARSCLEALKAAVELYRELRAAPTFGFISRNAPAEATAVEFIQAVDRRLPT